MARPSPQSFEKRQREIRKRNKRAEKLERRLDRSYYKRLAKEQELDPDAGEPSIDADGPDDGAASAPDA